jgi:hypothetical protein
MTVYYSIIDVLDRIEKAEIGTLRLNILIPVSTTSLKTAGPADDMFQLSSHPKLLDLTKPDGGQDLARLVEDVPLYGINLELALDEYLARTSANDKIEGALRKAFGRDPLPSALHGAGDDPAKSSQPSLRHPLLGHIAKDRLCEIYVAFLIAAAPFNARDIGFEADILGKHPERFVERFEGFLSPQGSKIKASILLAFGNRLDHDPGKALESYVEAGQKKAIRMRISDPREMLWAWLEADHHQMRHCRDLDRVLKLDGLPRRPNWVRFDVFHLLEKEAVKQRLAETYLRADPELEALADAPSLKKAVRDNAEGRVDEILQQLLSQTLNLETGYSGSASRFAEAAEIREREAGRISRFPRQG